MYVLLWFGYKRQVRLQTKKRKKEVILLLTLAASTIRAVASARSLAAASNFLELSTSISASASDLMALTKSEVAWANTRAWRTISPVHTHKQQRDNTWEVEIIRLNGKKKYFLFFPIFKELFTNRFQSCENVLSHIKQCASYHTGIGTNTSILQICELLLTPVQGKNSVKFRILKNETFRFCRTDMSTAFICTDGFIDCL